MFYFYSTISQRNSRRQNLIWTKVPFTYRTLAGIVNYIMFWSIFKKQFSWRYLWNGSQYKLEWWCRTHQQESPNSEDLWSVNKHADNEYDSKECTQLGTMWIVNTPIPIAPSLRTNIKTAAIGSPIAMYAVKLHTAPSHCLPQPRRIPPDTYCTNRYKTI